MFEQGVTLSLLLLTAVCHADYGDDLPLGTFTRTSAGNLQFTVQGKLFP